MGKILSSLPLPRSFDQLGCIQSTRRPLIKTVSSLSPVLLRSTHASEKRMIDHGTLVPEADGSRDRRRMLNNSAGLR